MRTTVLGDVRFVLGADCLCSNGNLFPYYLRASGLLRYVQSCASLAIPSCPCTSQRKPAAGNAGFQFGHGLSLLVQSLMVTLQSQYVIGLFPQSLDGDGFWAVKCICCNYVFFNIQHAHQLGSHRYSITFFSTPLAERAAERIIFEILCFSKMIRSAAHTARNVCVRRRKPGQAYVRHIESVKKRIGFSFPYYFRYTANLCDVRPRSRSSRVAYIRGDQTIKRGPLQGKARLPAFRVSTVLTVAFFLQAGAHMPGLPTAHVQKSNPPDCFFQQLDALKTMPLVAGAQ